MGDGSVTGAPVMSGSREKDGGFRVTTSVPYRPAPVSAAPQAGALARLIQGKTVCLKICITSAKMFTIA